MKRPVLIIAVFVVTGSALFWRQPEPQVSAQARPAANCVPISPPPCREGAFPGVVQIIPDGSSPANKSKLARKRLYLSSCPFNLSTNVSLSTAPTLRDFYRGVGASGQLVGWLEENHCESIYCRELTMSEAKCEAIDASKCVPEFTSAYRNALADLKGDADLALKMIRTYAPLSEPQLRTGFYEARVEWLKNAVAKIENTVAAGYRIRTTVTDKDGIGFFYELCPGSYYVSSVAPIDIDGVELIWETARPIKVEGPPDMKTATRVTLAFPPSKDKKNYFAGKPLSDLAGQKSGVQ